MTLMLCLMSCRKEEMEEDIEVKINVNQQYTIDKGFLFEFKTVSENALAYFWTFGDGTSSIRQNPVKRFHEEGKYHVKLKVYGAGNKSSIDTMTVVVGKYFITDIEVLQFPKRLFKREVGYSCQYYDSKAHLWVQDDNGLWRRKRRFYRSYFSAQDTGYKEGFKNRVYAGAGNAISLRLEEEYWGDPIPAYGQYPNITRCERQVWASQVHEIESIAPFTTELVLKNQRFPEIELEHMIVRVRYQILPTKNEE